MRNAILASALLLATPLAGDQLRIATSNDWRQWQLPGDAVEIARGTLKPSFVRRNINAVANAFDFASGGIRKVGSNPGDALNFIDGDPATYWAPDPNAPVEDWWIEVDLGRVVSARKIEVHFAADSTPLEFFKILTSDGEPFFSNANSILPGTLRYNKRWRYSFNEAHVIEIDYELKPLKNIRIEADLPTENIRLSEVVVESIGDNISLGIWGRGGSVEIISEATSKLGRTLIESKGISNTLVDGDITTYWGTVHRGGSGTQPEQQIGQFEIDLGALYWVDRVRMLGDDSGVAPGKGSGRHRAGVFNYLWYQFFVSDGSLAPDGSLSWELLGELPSDRRNLTQVRHFQERFPLRKVRHVRLIFPMSEGFEAFNGRIGTTAEWQVFGEGYPAEVMARSPNLRPRFHTTHCGNSLEPRRAATNARRNPQPHRQPPRQSVRLLRQKRQASHREEIRQADPQLQRSHRHHPHRWSGLEQLEPGLCGLRPGLPLSRPPTLRAVGSPPPLRRPFRRRDPRRYRPRIQ